MTARPVAGRATGHPWTHFYPAAPLISTDTGDSSGAVSARERPIPGFSEKKCGNPASHFYNVAPRKGGKVDNRLTQPGPRASRLGARNSASFGG